MTDNQKDNLESLKDSSNSQSMAVTEKPSNIPFNKANKLITALFMVTDIIDKDEPIRAKLRALGMDVISDIHTSPVQAQSKVSQIVSFLDIASTMSMISEMNAGILKKEFHNLNNSINESTLQGSSAWLEKFMVPTATTNTNTAPVSRVSDIEITRMPEPTNTYKGHKTRLGVQTPRTLLKVLSSVDMSNKFSQNSNPKESKDNFDVLKKQRRDEIIKVIKESKEALARGGATITDIRIGAKSFAVTLGITALLSCSEKTLQRELVSMVKDNVLRKTGEKRWSKYFV